MQIVIFNGELDKSSLEILNKTGIVTHILICAAFAFASSKLIILLYQCERTFIDINSYNKAIGLIDAEILENRS